MTIMIKLKILLVFLIVDELNTYVETYVGRIGGRRVICPEGYIARRSGVGGSYDRRLYVRRVYVRKDI